MKLACLALVALGCTSKRIENPTTAPEPALSFQTGHTDAVLALAMAPNGTLLSASADRTVRTWDVEHQRDLRILSGHTGAVHAVAVSLDGRTAVSAGEDHTVRMWNVETGRLLRTFTGHTEPIRAVALHPGGDWVVSGGGDSTLRYWNTTDAAASVVTKLDAAVLSLAFSQDGRQLAVGTSAHGVRVLDFSDGRDLWRLQTPKDSTGDAVVFSPDGRFLASSSWRVVQVWSLTTGALVHQLRVDGTPEGTALCFLRGNRLAAADGDVVRIWELARGREVERLGGKQTYAHVAYDPTGRVVVAMTRAGQIEVWDVSRRELLLALRSGRVGRIAVGPVAFVVIASPGLATQYDLATGRSVRSWGRDLTSVAASPDGQTIVTAGSDGSAELRDTANGRVLATATHGAAIANVAFDASASRPLLI